MICAVGMSSLLRPEIINPILREGNNKLSLV
jgi:hypothetical protein